MIKIHRTTLSRFLNEHDEFWKEMKKRFQVLLFDKGEKTLVVDDTHLERKLKVSRVPEWDSPVGNVFPTFMTEAVAEKHSLLRHSRPCWECLGALVFPALLFEEPRVPFGTRYFGFYDQVGRRDR